MPGKSDYLETTVLNSVLRAQAFPSVTGNVYISLHTADPLDAGTGTEVTGGSYARVAVSRATGSWSAPADDGSGNQQVSNSGAITFPTPSANWPGPITHFGVWDAITAGNLFYSGPLGTSRTVNNGDSAPSFAAAALVIKEG